MKIKWWRWSLLVVLLILSCPVWSTARAMTIQARFVLGWIVNLAAPAIADAAFTMPGHWAGNWWTVKKPADPNVRLVVSRLLSPTAVYDVTPLLNTRELDGEIAFSPPQLEHVFWQSQNKYWPVWLPTPELVTQPGQVIISEVMADGDDQWLELYNRTGEPRQLQGLRISGANDRSGDILLDRPLWMAPYGLVVVGRYTGELTALGHDPDYIDPNIYLGQLTSGITLLSSDNTIIDTLPSGTRPPPPNSADSIMTSAIARRRLHGSASSWDDWKYCWPDNRLCRGVDGETWKNDHLSAYGTPWLPPL